MKHPLLKYGIAIIALIGIISLLRVDAPTKTSSASDTADRSTNGDQQVMTIVAKGGYQPRTLTAKAGVPLTLNFKTNGSFDCSTAVVIPALRYHANLPPTGTTSVEIPAQNAGTVLNGQCEMGMYRFSIKFL